MFGAKEKRLNMTKALKKRITNAFEVSGQSTHSKNAETLEVIIAYCEDNKIPYILRAIPGMGYHIEKDLSEDSLALAELAKK